MAKCPIYTRVYLGEGKEKLIATGLKIAPADFNKKSGRVHFSHPLANDYNLILSNKEKKIERQYITKESGTFENGITLKDYWLQHLENLALECSVSHIENLRSVVDKFEGFRAGVMLNAIDYDYLVALKSHCLKKGNSINTVNKNFEQLRALIREAIRSGKFDKAKNPFDHLKMTTTKAKKERLSADDIKKLTAYVPVNYEETLAHTMYLFSFYNGGVRFGDLCRMQWDAINSDTIAFTPNKTKRSMAEKVTNISPPVRELIETIRANFKTKKYIFPILEGKGYGSELFVLNRIKEMNALLNRKLKIISRKLKLPIGEKISMHTSRHSFADMAVDMEIDPYTLMQLLGHKKFSTTQIYLQDFNKKKTGQAIKTMFGE